MFCVAEREISFKGGVLILMTTLFSQLAAKFAHNEAINLKTAILLLTSN